MNVRQSNIPKDHPRILKPKVGIIFGNLGTPDSTDYWSIRRYLKEFLSDRRVIDYSPWVWKPILNLILLRRPFSSGDAYKEIWNIEENESPLLTITKAQTKKLRARLNLAYGDKGYPPIIPPHATLVYDIELISFSSVGVTGENVPRDSGPFDPHKIYS